MQEITYYDFVFYDNDSYLLEKSPEIVCPNCQMYVNKRNLIENFIGKYKSKKKKSHFLCSYDGFFVVSKQFKDLYETQQWEGLIFYEIPKNKGLYYLIECHNMVSYNENYLSAEEYCPECKQYKSVVVKDWRKVITEKPLLKNTFYRTNWEFAYDFEQQYLFVFSEEIKNTIIEHQLAREIDFSDISVRIGHFSD